MQTIIQRLDFDAAHRITLHGSKCRNLHGHRYGAEVYATGRLDDLGMVIDFGVIKKLVGGWLDEHLDHGLIVHGGRDTKLAEYAIGQAWKVYLLDREPTAENLAALIFRHGRRVLEGTRVTITKVRLYETPFCAAEYEEP